MNDFIDWEEGRRNARMAGKPYIRPRSEPKIDEEVSKAIGKPIYVNDGRLLKAVAELKKMRGASDDPRTSGQDNFLKDGQAIEFLKKKLA